MTFSEKLTFLLELSGTTNAELARAADIDPSQVSRLKNGTRNTPKRAHTIELMAKFFAEHCSSEYQRAALAETIGEKSLLFDQSSEHTVDVMCRWFRSKHSDSSTRLGNFMRSFEGYDGQMRCSELPAGGEIGGSEAGEIKMHAYYGNEGRRAAVINCLDNLLEYGEPCEVLVVSDENVDWMIQEKEFGNLLITRVLKLVEKGFTMRRIVSSFRDSSMAIESLERWMPVYMTGALSSFYYPRLRDGIFRRLMIIAPGNFSLSSTAVGDQHECGATYVCYDKRAIEDDIRIFSDYFDKCVPLTEAYVYHRDPVKFTEELLKFHDLEAAGMSKWMGMSCTTLPGAIIDEMEQVFTGAEHRQIIRVLRSIQGSFEKNLSSGMRYVEIIRLHTREQVLNGEAQMSPSLLLPNSSRFYTSGEYRLHLKRILSLLEQYPSYYLVIDEGDMPDCELHVKEDKAALLVRTSLPFTLFDVTESNTVSACREYFMMYATLYGASLVIQRRHAIEKIRALYDALG